MNSQDGRYRLFGAELSPYSIKVRSYLRYKELPHDWIVRSQANEDEFRGLAKLPLVPLLVMPDGSVLQDSTPIIERLEQVHPEPSIHPPGPVAAFVSALLEEYGDEWGNKPMFHYRWAYEPDQASAARRIAVEMMPGIDEATLAQAVEMVRARMVPRLSFVGSSDATRPAIEGSFLRLASILEEHLAGRPYVFGGRPAFADFGLYPQIRQAATDPTAGALLRERFPGVLAWTQRMLSPSADGWFESWEALAPTLAPLLRDEVAGVFRPWSTANAKALAAGEKEFALDLAGRPFRQETQKYHARSLDVLRRRYAAVAERSALDRVLDDTDCLRWLRD